MPFDNHEARVELGIHQNVSEPDYLPTFSYATAGKRLLDVTLVILSMPVVFPVIVLMALMVALDGYSPFYTQKRIGLNGRTFRILKIRTMVHNADALLQQHLAENPVLAEEWNTTQKLKNDIRITRLGRFLRRTSMDELPQLINVLTGSMSLVGPRPMMVSQRSLYPGTSYFRLRPGLTGFWQISDRNNCSFRDRAKYDAEYERAVSLRTDISVLFRTVSVVLRGTGY
ncbi:sugar transferase [Roseobacter sp. S98]|uniref:sugar transferase n=1 Tax=Roseobacter algicola (ex Choi et al. 2025) (nom. illeg.) TaxID=3092138 RepID=UPI0035C7610D